VLPFRTNLIESLRTIFDRNERDLAEAPLNQIAA
jgi:hypothetical protein